MTKVSKRFKSVRYMIGRKSVYVPLDTDRFLFDKKIFDAVRQERTLFTFPTNFSKFFTLSADGHQYQYGAMFEPHVDTLGRSPTKKGNLWTHQFCFWRKDFVFFHTQNNQIVIVNPTLEPITFNFKKLHGFIPRRLVKDIGVKDVAWWKKRTEFYMGTLIFIGKFL